MQFIFRRLLCFICSLSLSVLFLLKPISAEPHSEIAPAFRSRLAETISKVSPAVVQISRSSRQVNTGVIVTAEGHIATSIDDRKVSDSDEQINIRLADGRHATAKHLGWSGVWRVELLKIEGESQRPWPHVDLNSSAEIQPGQPCLLIGYSAGNSDVREKPIAQLSSIEQSAFPYWYITSTVKQEVIGGFFDLQGNFLGTTTRIRPPSHTGAGVFSEHWSELVAGKNVDRLLMTTKDDKDPSESLTSRGEGGARLKSSIERATSATVRITSGGKPAGSGVIVTNVSVL